MNEPFDKSKYQGKWESHGFIEKLSDNPMRFDCDGNRIDLASCPTAINPEYTTPPDGTITGGGIINGEEFVEIMRDGKPVRYFRE